MNLEFFFSVNELQGCSFNEMFNCIMSVLKGKKFSKLIGFASNGASVITRVKNRVSTLVKGKNPFTLSMHCLSYRLALTSEKA